ncbi:MAG: hypothetical protein WA549_10030 [Thermoplasmata archaeon]
MAGVAYATVSLPSHTQSAAGQYVKYNGSVPGVAGQGVLITIIPTPAPAEASSLPILNLLTMGPSTPTSASTYCGNTCTAGDFAQEVEYLVTAQLLAEAFELSINAQSGSTTVSVTLYFQVPATATGMTTTYLGVYTDLTTTSSTTSFTATIQLCSSSTTCP